MQALTVKCPECKSSRIYKDGLRYSRDNGPTQRFLCRNCGYRFSQSNIQFNIRNKRIRILDSSSDLAKSSIRNSDLSFEKLLNDSALSFRKDIGSHNVTVIGKPLNSLCSYRSSGEYASKSKNSPLAYTMSETETLGKTSELAGTQQDIKGKILEFLWQLKKEGLKEPTLKTYDNCLKILINSGANLLEPESVKEVLAKKQWSDNTKTLMKNAYSKFLEVKGGSWKAPKYRINQKLPFIPQESELDALISGARKKLATFLRLLKDTGLRSGEAWRLKWIDIDFEQQTLTVNDPEKHGKPRILKISSTLIAMLKALQTENERVFIGNLTGFRTCFRRYTKRMSLS